MVNTIAMEQHFERDKNLKASAITVAVCACIFLLFFLISWTVPQVPKPEPMEGIEVNLGNSDFGSGNEQPLVQGTPGPTSSPDNNTPPQTSGTNSAAPDKTEPDNDPEAPPVTTPTKTTVAKTTPSPAPVKKAVVMPTPAPPKPKAVQSKSKYEGGNGNGGNSDTYNKSTSQGDDANGTKGDKGKPNGTVDGKGYTGTGGNGNGNVKIKGDRKMMYYPTYITDVQPGTVVVSVKVSAEGTGVFIDFLQGQFLAAYKIEIIKYLRGVKFNKADHESMIEMTFIFKR